MRLDIDAVADLEYLSSVNPSRLLKGRIYTESVPVLKLKPSYRNYLVTVRKFKSLSFRLFRMKLLNQTTAII